MYRTRVLLCALLIIALLSACASATPTPAPQPTAQAETVPTDTPEPTAIPTNTPLPTITPTPAPTSLPTAESVAPEATFMLVGSVAEFSGEHGVSGKAIIAGLQTMIIQRFNIDGKGSAVNVILTLDGEVESSVATLVTLEQRAYNDETVVMRIPVAAGPGTANSITIYCPETDTVYATARFR